MQLEEEKWLCKMFLKLCCAFSSLILILWVWSGPWGSLFLTSSQMMLVPDHASSNQVLNDHHFDMVFRQVELCKLNIKQIPLIKCIILFFFLFHRWFPCLLEMLHLLTQYGVLLLVHTPYFKEHSDTLPPSSSHPNFKSVILQFM